MSHVPMNHYENCGRCHGVHGDGQCSNPLPCAQCGKPVEQARLCYETPTCYGCLPPPEPLPVIEWCPRCGHCGSGCECYSEVKP